MSKVPIATTDVLLAGLMVVSLAAPFVAYELKRAGFLLFAGSVLATTLFFAIPLSDAFLRGKTSVLSSWKDQTTKSPKAVFQESIRSRKFTWIALWGLYYVALEAITCSETGLPGILTVPSLGLVLLMYPVCFLVLRRASGLWNLAGLTVVITTVPFLLVWGSVYAALVISGSGGYMGIGLYVLPPWITGSVLALVSLGLWIVIRRHSLGQPVRFRIRTLLAVTAGFACVAWIIGWHVRNDADWQLIVSVVLWAIGSSIGIYAFSRRKRSTLLGSLLGGWTAVVVIWAWWVWTLIDPKADLAMSIGMSIGMLQVWLAFSAGASGILAMVVGVLREGITISRRKDLE